MFKREFFIENLFTTIFMSVFFITNLCIIYGIVKLYFYILAF